MSLRARIFIIISVAVLLILGVSLILVISARRQAAGGGVATSTQTATPTPGAVNVGGAAQTGTVVPSGLPVKKQTTLAVEQAGVKQLARIFAERYGTYSSQNNSENIKEVESLCTRAFWAKISARIGATAAAQEYAGMTTRVITADISSWKNDEAVIALRTMRTEEKGGVVTTKYQNAKATLIKSGDDWLVDQFVWE